MRIFRRILMCLVNVFCVIFESVAKGLAAVIYCVLKGVGQLLFMVLKGIGELIFYVLKAVGKAIYELFSRICKGFGDLLKGLISDLKNDQQLKRIAKLIVFIVLMILLKLVS